MIINYHKYRKPFSVSLPYEHLDIQHNGVAQSVKQDYKVFFTKAYTCSSFR